MAQNELSGLRLRAGLSIEELALLIGYSPRHIYRWEAGEGKPREAVLNMLRSMASAQPSPAVRWHDRFTFIDLFAGIGGLRKGFEKSGGHCVFTSEWNKFAQQTYA